MANTTAVYARIDTGLKNNAEEILSKLGITPSAAIQMLYSQIILTGGMPFQPKLPDFIVISQMKENYYMKSENIFDLALVRLDRAKELILEAETLLEKESFKSANN